MSTVSGETPLYRGIADELRYQILEGELAGGARLPTEKELADQHEVSRNTVRQALNALANEGLISSGRARAGRVVRKIDRMTWNEDAVTPGEKTRGNGVDDFMSQATALGLEASEQILVRVVTAESWLVRLLRLDEPKPWENPVDDTQKATVEREKKLLAMRRRYRQIGGEVSQVCDSFYPYGLVKLSAIMQPTDIGVGAIKMLEQQGYVQRRYEDEITTRMPRPDETHELGIAPGVPVFVHLRIGFADEGPLRVTRTIMPGDRHTLRYIIPA